MGKKRDKRPETPEKARITELYELLKGGVLAGAIALLLLAMCALLMSAGILRERWMEGLVLLVCVLGAVVGGGVTVARVGERGLLTGVAVGMSLSLVLLTVGVLVYDADPMAGGLRVILACLCGGGIAGVLFGKPKKKRRH